MRIGILADTHDNLPQIRKAVRFFKRRRVNFVLHAGDFISPFAVRELLRELPCGFYGVFGNNDGERVGLSKVSKRRIKPPPLKIILNGRRIILVHDINSISMETEKAELIVSAHTHKPEISRKSSFLLVNPGECGGWLSGRSSVAIIDLEKLNPAIFYL